MATTKHIPERTCIACRSKRPKRELVRIVRGPAGIIGVDPAGRQPGRGAYFCPAQECWELGLRKGRLEYALRMKLSAEDRSRLAGFILGLPTKVAEASR